MRKKKNKTKRSVVRSGHIFCFFLRYVVCRGYRIDTRGWGLKEWEEYDWDAEEEKEEERKEKGEK
jgi:hypothetical protein